MRKMLRWHLYHLIVPRNAQPSYDALVNKMYGLWIHQMGCVNSEVVFRVELKYQSV